MLLGVQEASLDKKKIMIMCKIITSNDTRDSSSKWGGGYAVMGVSDSHKIIQPKVETKFHQNEKCLSNVKMLMMLTFSRVAFFASYEFLSDDFGIEALYYVK